MLRKWSAIASVVVALTLGSSGVALAQSPQIGSRYVGQTTAIMANVGGMSVQANCTVASVSPDGGAFACWNPTGEWLYNCDSGPDHHPRTYYYRSTSPSVLRNVDTFPGQGNCTAHNLDNIPESGWVELRACNYEGSTRLSCDPVFRRVSANG
jgi:hypothetical protein